MKKDKFIAVDPDTFEPVDMSQSNFEKYDFVGVDLSADRDDDYNDESEGNNETHDDMLDNAMSDCEHSSNHNDDLQNKKDFIKETLDGIPHKKTLKDFLTDPRSYKQFRDSVDECLFYMDWEKIHRVMESLGWIWVSWKDNNFIEHKNSVPSAFGIKMYVYELIQDAEEFIMNHETNTHYKTSTGGFEIEIVVTDFEEGDVDDFKSRVNLSVKFVLENFDSL